MSKRVEWTMEPCPCGQCTDYWWIKPGKFVQGSGFTKEQAGRIVRACNAHDAFAHAADLLASAFAEFDDIENMDAADFKDKAALTWGAVEAARKALAGVEGKR